MIKAQILSFLLLVAVSGCSSVPILQIRADYAGGFIEANQTVEKWAGMIKGIDRATVDCDSEEGEKTTCLIEMYGCNDDVSISDCKRTKSEAIRLQEGPTR